jgi:hypothetical protein
MRVREGFTRNKLYDAVSYGKFVVVSNDNGIPTHVKSNQCLIEEESDWKKCVIRILDETTLQEHDYDDLFVYDAYIKSGTADVIVGRVFLREGQYELLAVDMNVGDYLDKLVDERFA